MVATKSDSDKKDSSTIDLKKTETAQRPKTSAVAKKSEPKIQYRINGLSTEREKEAIAMLDAGKEITEVMEIYGVARSDIMTFNPKR